MIIDRTVPVLRISGALSCARRSGISGARLGKSHPAHAIEAGAAVLNAALSPLQCAPTGNSRGVRHDGRSVLAVSVEESACSRRATSFRNRCTSR